MLSVESRSLSGPAIAPRALRDALGHYPTGVAVVTALDRDGPAGLSVGSFTSVSLEPPLVGFLPARNSTSWPRIEATGRFCVNVLAVDQEPVCRALARPGGAKFEGVAWEPGPHGTPRIGGAVLWIDCELEQIAEAGDHWFVTGRVAEAVVSDEATEPLLFHRTRYRAPGP